jgi:hypothetical protein
MTRQLSVRLNRIEETMLPKEDKCGGTMEDFCRAMWRSDPAGCLQRAEEPGGDALHSWIGQFQVEDARSRELADRFQPR